MSQRFFSPNQQFYNDTGVPYAGGFLYFYASGTSTPQNTWSDSGLTIANLNPVILDSAGRAGSVFLANSAYKVVLADSNNVQIWTEDPVWSSDYSTVAMFTVNTGNPNGSVAGTAGTQGGRPSDVVWDNVNDILYVATTSGNATTTVWTAVNPSSATGAVSLPTGRLTLTSATPVINADATAQTAVLYTPYNGSTVPIYNGSTFAAQQFAELTLTLVSAHALNTLYDVFVFNNSGVVTLVTGPAWTNSAAGTSARGSGAGTTQIARVNGLWTNAVQITGRNGATTYTITANTATYLGTIQIDGTAGQCSCYVSYGQSRKFGVWNAFNRVPIIMKAGDGTASWTYGTNTIRASNGNSANSITIMTGLAEEMFDLASFQQITWANNSTGPARSGIGVNSTVAFSGTNIGAYVTVNTGSVAGAGAVSASRYILVPQLGINTITMLETPGSAVTNTFNGTEASMLLTTQYRG